MWEQITITFAEYFILMHEQKHSIQGTKRGMKTQQTVHLPVLGLILEIFLVILKIKRSEMQGRGSKGK